ncbi:Uncharacterised protein [Candidatus Gugararchaeum adminiculabundum]|nr:Uncharacterised protein [Candidatus Gugararchaeum adminiculabundum]
MSALTNLFNEPISNEEIVSFAKNHPLLSKSKIHPNDSDAFYSVTMANALLGYSPCHVIEKFGLHEQSLPEKRSNAKYVSARKLLELCVLRERFLPPKSECISCTALLQKLGIPSFQSKELRALLLNTSKAWQHQAFGDVHRAELGEGANKITINFFKDFLQEGKLYVFQSDIEENFAHFLAALRENGFIPTNLKFSFSNL